MFWFFLVLVLAAALVFKLGALSVWVKVMSMALTLIFLAALGWGVLALLRRLRRRA